MASTPIEFRYFTGLAASLTADLTASDDSIPLMVDAVTPATGLAATENPNGKGRYYVTYTGTSTGHHILTLKNGTDVVTTFDYSLADTTDIQFPQTSASAACGTAGANITIEDTLVTVE